MHTISHPPIKTDPADQDAPAPTLAVAALALGVFNVVTSSDQLVGEQLTLSTGWT